MNQAEKLFEPIVVRGVQDKNMKEAPVIDVAAAQRTLQAQGFSQFANVSGLLSVAHLFGATRTRCGLYALSFSDGLFYIGQAVDAARRFAQHRVLHNNIRGFAFRSCNKTDLDREEQYSITVAERAGIPLTNRIHVSQVSGETDLDSVLSPEHQKAWLSGKTIQVPGGVVFDGEHPQRLRFRHPCERLSRKPHYQEITPLLTAYVQNCIPAPRATQFSFWSVTALPTTNRTYWPRLAAINVNAMETLVVGHYRDDPEKIWSFVNVTASVLKENVVDLASLSDILAGCNCRDHHYRTAGPDFTQISCEGIDALRATLSHLGAIRAAKTFVLRLMRKGPTIFSKFHAPDLADLIISGRSACAALSTMDSGRSDSTPHLSASM